MYPRMCKIVFIAVLLLGFQGLSGISFPQGKTEAKWPARPIELIVPSTAGSSADILGRELARALKGKISQPVVITNKPGGEGAICLLDLASKPADGHTFAIITRSLLTAMVGGESPVKLKDFDAVCRLFGEFYVLGVKSNSQFAKLDGLLTYAKSNPGKLSMGGFASGSGSHLAVAMFFRKFQASFNWVPFPGTADATAALLGGHVDSAMLNASNLVGHVKAGRVKVLVVSGKERLNLYPDSPTFAEAGAPDAVQTHWRGIVVKKGTSAGVINTMADLLKQTMGDPAIDSFCANNVLSKAYLSPREFEAALSSEFEILAKLRTEIGMK